MNQQTIIDIFHGVVKYITFDNITFLLALIGSIGTAWNVIQSKVHIDMKIINFQHSENKILIYLMFQNKSRLPVSIGKISIKINDVFYSCVEIPTRVEYKTYRSGKTVTGYAHYYNMNLPVNLGGLAGTSGYILFELPKGIDIPDSKYLTFQIVPNRGWAIERKCQLPQQLM